eukprot:2300709-Amphidinium_carterae.1
MDPTEEELRLINSVGAAFDWAGISGSPTDPGSDAETLLAHLSISAESHPRLVAVFTDEEWAEETAGWLPGGLAPNAMQKACVRLVLRACRSACSGAAPAPAAAKAVVEVASERKVKLSQFVDPVKEESKTALTQAEISTAYSKYRWAMGASPSPAEECTAEQLSAVAALLRDGDPPFVDFSLFTPFNRRLQ